MASSQPLYYIGCRLSLMSKAKLRYEGTLAGIDTEKCTVELHNVESFGTEERVPAPNKIPPTPGSYDLIIFNGHDLDDLKVIPEKSIEIQDPAIINAPKKKDSNNNKGGEQNGANKNKTQASSILTPSPQVATQNPLMGGNQNQQPTTNKSKNSILGNQDRPSAFSKPDSNREKTHHSGSTTGLQNDNNSVASGNHKNQSNNNNNINNNNRVNHRDNNRENNYQNYQEKRLKAQQEREARQQKYREEREKRDRENLEKYKAEFDFTDGLNKFNKDEISKEFGKMNLKDQESKNPENEPLEDGEIPEQEDDEETRKTFYDSKKSFFDSISCEATDKGDRVPRFKERKLNSETFGIPERPRFDNNNHHNHNNNNRGYNSNNRGYHQNGGYNNNNRQTGGYQSRGTGYQPREREGQSGYNSNNNRGTGYNSNNRGGSYSNNNNNQQRGGYNSNNRGYQSRGRPVY